ASRVATPPAGTRPTRSMWCGCSRPAPDRWSQVARRSKWCDGVKKKPTYWAHPTAVIDRGAQVGAETKIWHFCHVTGGARIGSRCVLGQNAFVAGGAMIGDGCRIQNN